MSHCCTSINISLSESLYITVLNVDVPIKATRLRDSHRIVGGRVFSLSSLESKLVSVRGRTFWLSGQGPHPFRWWNPPCPWSGLSESLATVGAVGKG